MHGVSPIVLFTICICKVKTSKLGFIDLVNELLCSLSLFVAYYISDVVDAPSLADMLASLLESSLEMVLRAVPFWSLSTSTSRPKLMASKARVALSKLSELLNLNWTRAE